MMRTQYHPPSIERIGSLAQLTGAPGECKNVGKGKGKGRDKDNPGNNKPGIEEDLVGMNPPPDCNTRRLQGS